MRNAGLFYRAWLDTVKKKIRSFSQERTLTLAATVTEAVTFAPFCCRYQSLHQTRSGLLVLVALITRTTL